MRRVGMGIGGAALMLVGLMACVTDEEPSFEGTVILAEDAVPGLLSQVQCEQQMECDCLTVAGPVGEDPEAHTMETCLEHRRLELEFWQKGANFHGLTYDATCLARRLGDFQDLGCGDQLAWTGLQASGSCADRCRVYHGDLAEGEPCDLEEGVDRCDQGLYCDWSWDETTSDYAGTCKKACVADGESCLHAGCAPGSQCVDWICTPSPRVGDPCPEYWCLDGYCNPSTMVCEAPLAVGASCADSPGACAWGCLAGVCASGPAFVCGWDFREPYAYSSY